MRIINKRILQSFNISVLRSALLCACWIAFLILGVYVSTQVNCLSGSLMHTLGHSRMSIVAISCIAFIPLFLSVIAFRTNCFVLLIPIVCVKAYAFGFSCGLFYVHCFGAGWLMRWLFIFTDSTLVIFQLYYWLRNTLDAATSAYKGIPVYVLISFLLICFECCFVTPLVTVLINRLT